MFNFTATFDDGELMLIPILGDWYIVNEGQNWKVFQFNEVDEGCFVKAYPSLTEAHDAALELIRK